MNRRSILAAYKKKSSHFQTGVTGFKSGNLFTKLQGVNATQIDLCSTHHCYLLLAFFNTYEFLAETTLYHAPTSYIV